MKNNLIFIHIPKTGGTTINTAMQGTYWQTKPDFNYRHILLENKKSNSGDIFLPENFEKYKSYKIFMMLRHPIDRLVSEYYFMREKRTFMDLLRTKPKDFKNFIQSKQTQNGVVNFLKGNRMYDISPPVGSDLDDVLDAIDEIPIHVGIFEHFAESLDYFSEVTNIKWQKNIEVKRMTFKRPKVNEITYEIKELIIKNNPLDMELYEYCLTKFNEISKKTFSSKITFTKDKYNHVIPYCVKWCFFEFCMENKKFKANNLNFFKELTFFLLEKEGIRDGRVYTEIWNKSFLKSINEHFPNTPFSEALNNSYNAEGDQLEELNNIASTLDQFFAANTSSVHQYYSPMTFKESLAVVPQLNAKGIFKKLFRK